MLTAIVLESHVSVEVARRVGAGTPVLPPAGIERQPVAALPALLIPPPIRVPVGLRGAVSSSHPPVMGLAVMLLVVSKGTLAHAREYPTAALPPQRFLPSSHGVQILYLMPPAQPVELAEITKSGARTSIPQSVRYRHLQERTRCALSARRVSGFGESIPGPLVIVA